MNVELHSRTELHSDAELENEVEAHLDFDISRDVELPYKDTPSDVEIERSSKETRDEPRSSPNMWRDIILLQKLLERC